MTLISCCEILWIKRFSAARWALLCRLCFLFRVGAKIQQTKILIRVPKYWKSCLLGLFLQYSTKQKQYIQVGSKFADLSLPGCTVSVLSRVINFPNNYLSLLYFCFYLREKFKQKVLEAWKALKESWKGTLPSFWSLLDILEVMTYATHSFLYFKMITSIMAD